ncbi:hypothetical protein [Flavobacterium sp. 3HN19-14]|uniref:hypothetical protein n=1 Tax=Flavobacterium sp. 3HN19-14 TaxID=3448133 RepID=UPI003EE02B02
MKNAKTGQPLPFANIATSEKSAIADVDGKFLLASKTKISAISVSYVGFTSAKIPIGNPKKHYTVSLNPVTENLKEIMLENPAIAVMKLAIREKNHNNPQRKLSSFEFKSYNKLVITANPDSIDSAVDSIFIEKKGKHIFSKIDSSEFRFKRMITKRHLFQTEKVSQFQFAENHLKETILGTKWPDLHSRFTK